MTHVDNLTEDDRRERAELIGALVAARKAAGLSQYRVAKLMGVGAPAVNKMERQDKSPTLVTVQRYARAVGVKLCLQVCAAEPDEVKVEDGEAQ